MLSNIYISLLVSFFQLGVNGSNLNTLSKLILKVSKDNNNDLLFMEHNIVGKHKYTNVISLRVDR